MQTKAFEDMGEKEFGDSCHIDFFGAWNNDHPFRKAVVDHDHNRVFPGHFGEICDKVNGGLFEGEIGG